MFCYDCGKEKNVSEWTGKYNEQTGDKEMRLICPDECNHNRHDYKESRPVTLFRNPEKKCARCGKEIIIMLP
jgi:DNA-directed RNA polymerase subunit RPC12/RpoP